MLPVGNTLANHVVSATRHSRTCATLVGMPCPLTGERTDARVPTPGRAAERT